ncbi:MAG TPA: diaminopimelate decarboxylase [Gammaproteobacteria bacterium]|nr:diaminopimelate decarboxylase [Gammaproteobacteria bacterium]HIN89694.1 diaminopimelate decarboxylase [Porticoccaceae bacterium]
MDYFEYRGDTLFAEEVNVTDIALEHGTPCFIYSRATLERHLRAYQTCLGEAPQMICFAVKANSNLAVLNVLARLGAGFDIVSGGELERVIAAGGDPGKVIFSGLGKSEMEIEQALKAGIFCFNVESAPELTRIDAVASRLNLQAKISVRVNPDVDAGTHPYISTGLKDNKFGLASAQALEVYRQAATLGGIEVVGIDCHIGSQLTSLAPFLDAVDHLLVLVDRLHSENIHLRHLDIGGGLGVSYGQEQPPQPADLIAAVNSRLADRKMTLIVEPGRSIAANAGIFVTRVEYIKCSEHKNFAIVDGAMNDLLRPALYNAWQEIIPVTRGSGASATYDVVGPICESADFLGKDRKLQLTGGELLAVRSAGAYGFVMSSNYNSRPRAPEIMVDGSNVHLVRRRESLGDQLEMESCLPL